MKRICIIHNARTLGGGTNSFFDLIDMLQNEYEIIACIPQYAFQIIDKLKEKNVKHYEYNCIMPIFSHYSGGGTISYWKDLLTWKYWHKFAKEITELSPDIVIFNSIISAIAAKGFSDPIKKVCFIRETLVKSKIDLLYQKWLNSYFDGVCSIANSELQFLNLTVPNTVIADCWKGQKKEKITSKNNERFTILFMGGLDYIKGTDVILTSLKYLPEDCRLVCAGYFDFNRLKPLNILKTSLHPKLMFFLLRIRNCLRDKRITGKLEIIGYVNNISQLIEMADVLAFPSNVVHQLRPGIEAGYYKKPVILSDFEETKEYFIDGYNALVFQPGNAKGLADCIKRMYYDEKLRVTLGENNQKMTANYHNYEFVKSKLIAFLRIV